MILIFIFNIYKGMFTSVAWKSGALKGMFLAKEKEKIVKFQLRWDDEEKKPYVCLSWESDSRARSVVEKKW